MIFRFDNFVEKWCSIYKPIGHVPGDIKNRKFYRHDGMDERLDIVKNLVTANRGDVFASVITAFDGELARSAENAPKPNFYVWRRHVLFWVKGAIGAKGAPIDEESAAEAKARGVEIATDFIAFLDHCADPRRGNMAELRGVDFDSVEIATLPVSYNGWWITVINFDHMEPRDKCIKEAKYDTDALAEAFTTLNASRL